MEVESGGEREERALWRESAEQGKMSMCCCMLAIFDSCFETRGRRWKDWLGWLWLLCSGWQSKGTHLLGKLGRAVIKRAWQGAGQGRAG